MIRVDLFGLNETVEINQEEITEYKTDDIYYDESYKLDNGVLVAYDEAVCSCVI